MTAVQRLGLVLVTALAAFAAGAALVWTLAHLAGWTGQDGRPAVACVEDDPCWDWRTMGNRMHGVCIDGANWLESADGTLTAGGRGCDPS